MARFVVVLDANVLYGIAVTDLMAITPAIPAALVSAYHDVHVGVLASSPAKRAPGYVKLGCPDPRSGGR